MSIRATSTKLFALMDERPIDRVDTVDRCVVGFSDALLRQVEADLRKYGIAPDGTPLTSSALRASASGEGV